MKTICQNIVKKDSLYPLIKHHVRLCFFCTIPKMQNSSMSKNPENIMLMKWFLHFKGDSQRSSRNKKGDLQPSKCEQCEVTFPSKKELVLHNSKKCKSHQCEKCQKYYANERTLQSHSCEEEPIKGSLISESFSLWAKFGSNLKKKPRLSWALST